MSPDFLFDKPPSHWEVSTLGKICARGGGSVQTGPFGSQLHASDYVPFGIPSIMPENLGDDRISKEGIAHIRREDAERLSRYRVRPGDIVYSRRGDVTKRALVGQEHDGWLCGTGCLRVRFGDSQIKPRFAFYYLGHPLVRGWISRHAIGATLPNLNTSILSALPFHVPPPSEQAAIAEILGTLDDKIELTRRMNETLEAMARAIFKSWFVDFDPVRAKAEGRQPFGMDAATAALFPDSFEDSPLDKVPKGWRVYPVGEVVEVGGGSTPSTKEPAYWDGQIHWATPKDLSVLHSPVLLDTERRITEAGLEQIGSRVYPKGTLLLSSRAPIGYLAISEIAVAVNQGMIAVACGPNPSNHYMLQWTRTNMEVIESRASGTTFQEISKSNFRSIPVTIPADEVMKAFTERVEPLHRRMVNNLRVSRTLAAVRDALLPKLISGEIRVMDA